MPRDDTRGIFGKTDRSQSRFVTFELTFKERKEDDDEIDG